MNFQKMMQQAQKIQTKLAEVQDKLKDMEATGQAGGGLVTVTVNGKGEMKNIVLDPEVVRAEDREVLQDLIIAAFNDAKKKSEETASAEMSAVAGGLGIPDNFKFPF